MITQLFANLEEITADQYYQYTSRENSILLLDVRSQQDYDTWLIKTPFTPETMHVPYVIFVEDGPYALEELPDLNGVPPERDIVVICGKGDASDLVAAILREEGKTAVNLIGGMIAWGNYYTVHPIIEENDYQIYQIDRVARGCLSYVMVSNGQAAVIDPGRHTDNYRQFLAGKGTDLTLLLDTHAHADHISGGPDMAGEYDAPYYLHPYDAIHPFDMLPAVIDYHMLEDNQRLELGSLSIQVIHTPGHTLGQVNFFVTAPDGKKFLFSGDNLFIQSFGRPDLGGQGEAWAPIVYDTIFRRIKEDIPQDSWVLPGHYSTFDEANRDGGFTQPLEQLWRHNVGLQFQTEQLFTTYVLDHLPQMPQQYVEIKRVNIGLSQPNEEKASVLELGKNVCALLDVYPE